MRAAQGVPKVIIESKKRDESSTASCKDNIMSLFKPIKYMEYQRRWCQHSLLDFTSLFEIRIREWSPTEQFPQTTSPITKPKPRYANAGLHFPNDRCLRVLDSRHLHIVSERSSMEDLWFQRCARKLASKDEVVRPWSRSRGFLRKWSGHSWYLWHL